MERRLGLLAAVICSLFLFLLTGCGSDSDSTSSASLTSEDLFYETMRETTPVYDPLEAEALQTGAMVVPLEAMINAEDWGSGEVLYSVYFTLRDFQSPRDEGVVDRSNLYKLLFDAELVLVDRYSLTETLATAKAIASPFAGIDTSATLFTNAANNILLSDDEAANESFDADENPSVAYRLTGDIVEALVTWKCVDPGNPDKHEIGIAYYTYDKSTEDITIDMVYSVDYDISSPESTYNLRCKASGNIAEHSFQFNYLIGTTSIIAKGVSQGDGNYTIFKYKSGLNTRYLKVPAGEGESFFKDIYDGGSVEAVEDPSGIADPDGYLTWVQSEPFMDSDDLLTSTVQLNVGVTDLEGTINLDY